MSDKWWRCVHGIQPAAQCSECDPLSDALGGLGRHVGGLLEVVPDTARRRIAELEAALFRANNVTQQTQEIVDQRGRRIMELQTEVAALTDRLRTLFKSAAATSTVSRETPFDSVEFPANALKWSV